MTERATSIEVRSVGIEDVVLPVWLENAAVGRE